MQGELQMKKIKIGIIGGGASGMMAAITAASNGADVTVLEGGDRIGKKLLMTGNGKCNLGNLNMDSSMYYGSDLKWIMRHLERFQAEDTVEFFRSLGLLIKAKNGYLYPACEQAAVVLDSLRFEMQALGVKVITGIKIRDVKRNGNTVELSDGHSSYRFDRVIVACGGQTAPKTGSDGSGYLLAKKMGHHLIPVVPALVQLKCREVFMKALGGVRTEGNIRVLHRGECIAEESGEIQFTEYGISGIPVFQISRVINYLLREVEEVEVELDLLPGIDREAFEQFCLGRKLLQTDRTVEEFFTGILNKKIMTQFIKLAGLKPTQPIEQVNDAAIKKVYDLCKCFSLHVNGSNSFEQAQVCAGGVDVSELTEELESRFMPNVYFVGEILDVDGKCGGYNLQWAWCSGYLAGTAAAKSKG